MESEPHCKNCGAVADAHFCPQCGQSTRVAVPTVLSFLHDALGALFSYDHKLWTTLRTLVTRPGQLTVDYAEGRRVRYLTPFQLFFWLQTITFVAYRAFFNTQTGAADVMSRDLLLVGGFMAVSLALLHARRRLPFLIHLVAATHVWAFLMVLLLVEYTLVPHVANLLLKWHVVAQPLSIGVFVTRSVQVILVFYLTRALQVIFGNPLGKAALKTVILFGLYQGFVSLVTLN